MKHTLATMALIFLAFTSKAQTFGLQAGYTHVHIHVKNDSTLWKESQFVPGFNLAATVEFPLSDNFSLVSGLGFTTKGAKGVRQEEFNFTHPDSTYAIYHYEINILNLEIPLQAKYKFNTGDYNFFTALGPYVGLSIAAHSFAWHEFKYQLPYEHFPGTAPFTGKGDWNTNNDLQRLDYGAMGTIGFERNQFSFSASYSYGIANLSEGRLFDEYRIRYRSFEFSVGYRFLE